jgi:GNAT superfamily N-acetyltransferase
MSTRRSSELSLGARIVDGIRWRLGHLGLYITPFIMIREGARETEPFPLVSPFSFCALSEIDVDELVRLEPEYDREKLLDWFASGKLCFGLRDGPRLVAKTWCDVKEVNYLPAWRKLESNEAYLFAAYSDPEYRGRNLAPMLRAASYESLRQKGFDRFYSFSEYFNLPARRFKQKLGAVEEDLRIEVRLGRFWSRTFVVKHY